MNGLWSGAEIVQFGVIRNIGEGLEEYSLTSAKIDASSKNGLTSTIGGPARGAHAPRF